MHAEDGEVLEISGAWTSLTGYSIKEVPTFDAWLTRAYGEGADEVRQQMQELIKQQRSTLKVELPVRTRDGDLRYWIFSASSPGTLRDGRRYFVGMAVDITERRTAEAFFRESDERLRLMMESVEDYAILMLNAQGFIEMWNTGAQRMFGYTATEISGQHVEIIFTPEDRRRPPPRDTLKRDGDGARNRTRGRRTLACAQRRLTLLREQRAFSFARCERRGDRLR
jgi:PAS domain S-box-containing protein